MLPPAQIWGQRPCEVHLDEAVPKSPVPTEATTKGVL